MTEKQRRFAEHQAKQQAAERLDTVFSILVYPCCIILFLIFGFKAFYVFGFGLVAFTLIWIYFTVFDVDAVIARMDDEYHEPNYRKYEPTPAPPRVPKPEVKPKSAGVVIDEAAGTVEWEVIR